ncbi:hypothetical protein [Paenisporosarcina sp. TG20]|uniref:hypothetical protein n=1 Tax=Paenisporosarcina sp. TG20 TaxID=1211706 RepID=UPI000685DF72|nr:hypothetical protein [Paenisporosarcina sp. TG20]
MSEIIKAYQILFPFRQGLSDITTMDQLEDCIRIELLDELTHPRVRKRPDQKLQIAYERIDKSDFNKTLKVSLKNSYEKVFQSVTRL